MDWSKAKLMIIYVFIALNIFLFANICYLVSQKEIKESFIRSTKKILENNNIELECDIPKKPYYVNYYAYKEFEINTLIKNNDRKVKIKILGDNEFEASYSSIPKDFKKNNKNKIKKELLKISNDFNLNVDDFYFEEIVMKDNKIYGELFFIKENVILFDNKINYIIEDGKLRIVFRYYGYRNLKGSKVWIMPAYQILVKNFIERSEDKILSIDIGIVSSNEKENREYFDRNTITIWRVRLENGIRFFNATTGVEVFQENLGLF